MKSSRWGTPPPFTPQGPEQSPELAHAVTLERAFAAQLGRRKPWGTYAIVALCVATFLLQMALGRALDNAGVNYGLAVQHGQLWRLWSCTFLHANLIHIGGNMWVLIVLGPFVEKVIGTPRFLVLYAISGLCGSLLGGFVHPMIPSLGASGAIWGIMAAAFGIALRPQRVLPPLTAMNIKKRLLQPLLINVGLSLLPGVDAYAHLGGGLFGFLAVLSGAGTLGARPEFAGERESLPSKTIWTVLAVAFSLAMVTSLGVALAIALHTPPT